MKDKYVIARYDSQGEHFELIVDPNKAFDYKMGKRINLSEILISDEIYKDAKKGLKASEESLIKVFKTLDVSKIASTILLKGQVPLTAEQRQKLIDVKRKQIIAFISKNCIDPRTNLPHPPTRIELAINETHISIDPFRDVEEQAIEVIKALRAVLPLKVAQVIAKVKIPQKYASKAQPIISKLGELKKSNWLDDGGWQGEVEIPAGMQIEFIEKVNSLTHGEAEIQIIRG
ncbi:MAG: ribosome assembly factor SBDS [Candidatus Methanomethylicia archaeon]